MPTSYSWMRCLSAIVALFVVLSIAAGCKRRPREAEARADCAREAQGLRAWLDIVRREGPVDPDVDTARADGTVELLPHLDVHPARLDEPPNRTYDTMRFTLQQGMLSDRTRRRTTVAKAVERFAAYDVTSFIALEIAADEPWANVVTALAAAAATPYKDVALVFAAPTLAKMPRSTSVEREIERNASDRFASEAERRRRNERVLLDANPKCPAVGHFFLPFEPDATGAARQEEAFLHGAATAAEGCQCQVDLDAIRTFAWYRRGRQWGDVTVSRMLPLASSADTARGAAGPPDHVIRAPAAMPWREASTIVLAALDRAPKGTLFGVAVE